MTLLLYIAHYVLDVGNYRTSGSVMFLLQYGILIGIKFRITCYLPLVNV